jgi:hypothetical protein
MEELPSQAEAGDQLQLDVPQRHLLLYIRVIFKQEHTGRPSGEANATGLNNNRHITKVQGQSINCFAVDELLTS